MTRGRFRLIMKFNYAGKENRLKTAVALKVDKDV